MAESKKLLAAVANLTLAQLRELDNEAYAELQDSQVAHQVAAGNPRERFPWPYHTKSKPRREVSLLTHRDGRDPKKTARLIRLATLRSVDAPIHDTKQAPA